MTAVAKRISPVSRSFSLTSASAARAAASSAHVCLRLEQSRLNGRREDVLAREHRLHSFRGTERRQRLLEPTLREPKETSRLVHDQLGAGLTVRLQRALRSLQPRLGLIESPEPQQRRRTGGQGGDNQLDLRPSRAHPQFSRPPR